MQIVELIDLVKEVIQKKAERQNLEIKAAHIECPKRLYDTISAFSNQDGGGIILFGIDENASFSPVGIYDRQDLQKKVMEQCDQMEPPARAVFTFAEFDGAPVMSAEIPGLDYGDRPCYYRGSGRLKGSYIRVGDADMPMTDYEIFSYESFRQRKYYDEQPVPRATMQHLDSEKLAQYLSRKKHERPKFALLTDSEAMEFMNITHNGIPTLAAVLNFGLYPQAFFPQLSITAVAIPGENMGDTGPDSASFSDNRRIEGQPSEMVEEAIAFCIRNTKVKIIIDAKTGQRFDRYEYPVDALREIFINAIIHRDYSQHTMGTPIQIRIFRNRLEVHSPGTLYGRMTVEQLGNCSPDLRNPTLAVMTEGISGVENRYSGIPTIRREMAAAGLPAPIFENRRNEFVVILFNEINSVDTPSTQSPRNHPASSDEERMCAILTFCQTPKTRKEIAAHLGLKTIFFISGKYLQPLVNAGKLKMTKPDKPKSRNQKFYTA